MSAIKSLQIAASIAAIHIGSPLSRIAVAPSPSPSCAARTNAKASSTSSLFGWDIAFPQPLICLVPARAARLLDLDHLPRRGPGVVLGPAAAHALLGVV